MNILEVKQITVPDNVNGQPGVVPIPQQTFEAVMSAEGHGEVLRMIEAKLEARK